MTLHVKDGGTWKEVTTLYVKDAGSWKEVTSASVKDAGSWKEFKAPSGPSYAYTISTGSTSGGASIDSTWSISPNDSADYPMFDMEYFSSSPAGFWSANSQSTGAAYSGTMRSSSKTASAGTTVYLTYKLTFSSNGGSAQDTYVTFTHQF